MFANTSLIILWTSGVLVTAFALFRGGRPEQIGASINLACAIAAELAHMVWGPEDSSVPLLLIDFALALGFLLLAVRFASIWLGAAMLLQAAQFSLHAWYIVEERPHDLFYFRVNNIDTIGISLVLVIGTVMAWRRRRRMAREEAARELSLSEAASAAPTEPPAPAA